MRYIQLNVNQLIKDILKNEPNISDNELILQVWRKQGLRLTKAQEGFIFMCSSTETITRAKRKLRHKIKDVV